MEVHQQYQKISRSLNPNVKFRVRKLAPLYAEQAHLLQTTDSMSLAAVSCLKPHFPSASQQQLDVLAFYLLRLAVAAKGDVEAAKETVKANLDSMSEMGEMESLRLQMAMDRLSKMMNTLSNILKKMADTSSSIIQNIK